MNWEPMEEAAAGYRTRRDGGTPMTQADIRPPHGARLTVHGTILTIQAIG